MSQIGLSVTAIIRGVAGDPFDNVPPYTINLFHSKIQGNLRKLKESSSVIGPSNRKLVSINPLLIG